MRTGLAQVFLLVGGAFWTAGLTLAYEGSSPPSGLAPLWIAGLASIALAFVVDSAWYRGQVERIPWFRPATADVSDAIARGTSLLGQVRGTSTVEADPRWLVDAQAWWGQADALVARHAKWELAAFRNTQRMGVSYENVPAWAQTTYGNIVARLDKLADLQSRLSR